jgi:hypothetical protein
MVLNDIESKLVILSCAWYLETNQVPKDTQILSVLITLKTRALNKGIL